MPDVLGMLDDPNTRLEFKNINNDNIYDICFHLLAAEMLTVSLS